MPVSNRIPNETKMITNMEETDMKKKLIGIVTAGLVFGLSATSAFGACHGRGGRFVDENQDGICDYAGNVCYFADADGDGVCDTCGRIPGQSGINACHGNGSGRGHGCHRR